MKGGARIKEIEGDKRREREKKGKKERKKTITVKTAFPLLLHLNQYLQSLANTFDTVDCTQSPWQLHVVLWQWQYLFHMQ